ncbi:hypothetical protein HISP_17375 [Haloarcula hispanica N601]|uniref:Uncharacterized protein n=3 Tax=Haloarcula hispanica TaxID=51589 RepID=V5TT66_HALHI|nr:hypothetical protein [Haloarcula hispanica]AEM59102.1 hypothetical protein HAH_4431 [Haloarcula hispanica ATCC 33960]AHB67794.1 hypothetical protein HISP_17375 [Haloarcula hispanica N601]MCJ0617976.1 hypothetical protein [Haloarcula hispanica]RYJ15501.1 hypothetical protein ELS20_00045 [Haloarcula hispanica]
MATYYVLSSPEHTPDSNHSSEWPKELGLSFDDREIRLFQGKGHGLGGAVYDFEDFRLDEWAEFVDACAGDWLREELSRHGSLTAIDEADFVRTLNRHATFATEEH